MERLSIAVLGGLEITRGGREVQGFASNKARGLLAYLAVEADRAHGREMLAGLLWPDYPQHSALTNLRNALASLRQVIGDTEAETPVLLVTREALQLNPAAAVWVDLKDFTALAAAKDTDAEAIQRLGRAAELCRGTFLAGFPCDSAAFEDWIRGWRERLGRELRETLARLGRLQAGMGAFDAAVLTGRRLLALEPWEEEGHRLVMAGLARGGQRGAALAQYEACRRVLKDELGVEPDTETKTLAEQIRRGEVGAVEKAEQTMPRGQARLPTPLTSFIGRERELVEVKGQVAKHRLVTLSGAGGCGKTRLAIEAAHEMEESGCYPHGTCWVDLSAVSDAATVAATVAAAFGLAETGRTPAAEVLASFLRERSLLLVLDNCEHLVDAAAILAQRLLMESPGLRILATSREPLGVPGEVIWRVPSLGLPEDLNASQSRNASNLRQYDAVRLFEERAGEALPGWRLEDNLAAADVCARLDGIPLAIELAAARVRVLTVEQILARLQDAFHLLTAGSRTDLPRHQTLRACIDWSYNLLNTEEQALLRQLAVFQGSWTLEAAEVVCNAEPGADTFNLLARLVDRSLVVVRRGKSQAARYYLLETIRQYAGEKLAMAGEETGARCRHLIYFRDLVERAKGYLRGPDSVEWLVRLSAEYDNLQAALGWSLKMDVPAGLRIAGALFSFWCTRNLRVEGIGWLERLLAADKKAQLPVSETDIEHDLARGWALYALVYLKKREVMSPVGAAHGSAVTGWMTAFEQLRAWLDESQAIFSRLGMAGQDGLATTLRMQYVVESVRADSLVQFEPVYRAQNEPTMAFPLDGGNQAERYMALVEEGMRLARASGDRFVMAECMDGLGDLAMRLGRYAEAQRLFEEQRALRVGLSDQEGTAYVDFQLAWLAYAQNDYEHSRKLLNKALENYLLTGLHDLIHMTHMYRAMMAFIVEEYDQALEDIASMQVIARENGWEGHTAIGLFYQGWAVMKSDPAQASQYMRESLHLYRKVLKQVGTSYPEVYVRHILDGCSHLAILEGQAERAAMLFGAGIPPENGRAWQIERTGRHEQALRSALGGEVFERLVGEGRAMQLEAAIIYALEEEA